MRKELQNLVSFISICHICVYDEISQPLFRLVESLQLEFLELIVLEFTSFKFLYVLKISLIIPFRRSHCSFRTGRRGLCSPGLLFYK